PAVAQPSGETEKLLARLNLSEKGLEKVKQSLDDSENAVRELLNYFKQRNSVNHPINRNLKASSKGNIATEKDFETANNALEHIFVGQPAYPPYFCGDDIDWGTRPVPDNEWVWQLNRMSFWDAMGRVYWHTGDEKYAEAWGEQLIDWTWKNPNDEDHKYAWRSIEAGIRGYRWTGLFQRFIDSPSFTPDVLVAFLNSCHDHAEYLMTKYSTRSNWGLMEAEGMAFIAITFPEFKNAEKWREEAFRRFNNEINIQVYPDGHQRELAIGYHLGCIGWFFRTYELAKMNGIENAFPSSYLERIEKMCEVPMKLCLPNGTNVQFGDAWEGTPGQHKHRFREWADFFGRDDFLYLATDGQEGKKPDSTAYALPFSGLYSMRSGWNQDAVCLVLKCGPDGGGHSQPDNGTFDLYAGGRNLMPDAGSYIYSGDPEGRAWFRQTKVHQTLTLNGGNSKYDPKLLLWQPGENLDILVVENQSYENLAHRRSVFFVDKKYFVIVDEAIGNASGDVGLHFQLAPGSGAALSKTGVAVFNSDYFSVSSNFIEGWNVLVQTTPQSGLELIKEEGWVSFQYTKKEPRPAFCYRLNKGQNQHKIQFVTLVIPFEKEAPKIQIVRSVIESDKMEIEVVENGKEKIIGYKMN
ncbi:MAG TPA: alginate lyase family protein, partial [Mariniphaga anaerophila]|nr:alginate lyase family protein [Mariniphaga anaerophila]